MARIESASIWIIFAVLSVLSNEIHIAEGNKIYDDCRHYCKNDLKKDALTCWIWCNMRCMPSLGNDCLEIGARKSKAKGGPKPAEPPASPEIKSIAQSPLPQFFEAMEKNATTPEFKQYLDAMVPSLPSSPPIPRKI
ncbi:hypothetical protein AB3S75_015181 [Citrus x aurantiifolia]